MFWILEFDILFFLVLPVLVGLFSSTRYATDDVLPVQSPTKLTIQQRVGSVLAARSPILN